MKRKINTDYFFSVGECIGIWIGYMIEKSDEKKAGHISIRQQIEQLRKFKVK